MRWLRLEPSAGWPTVAALAGLIVVVAGLSTASGAVLPGVIATNLVFVALTVGLYVFAGNSGVFSFGHVGFAAIGAYTAAILVTPSETKRLFIREMPDALVALHTDSLIATALAGLIAAGVAVVMGLPLMRLSGLAASIGTFAFLIIVRVIAINTDALTNGRSGLTRIPVSVDVAVAAAGAVIAIVIAFLFQSTTLALRLRAAREEELAARSVGVRVFPERLVAWTVSAFLAGIAGAMYAQLQGTFSPDAFYLSLTFVIVSMLVVGGTGSLSGAVVGALSLGLLAELLRAVERGMAVGPLRLPEIVGVQQVGIGLLTLIVLIALPRGLLGGRELVVGRPHKPTAKPSEHSPAS